MNNFITEIINSNDYIQIKYILENKDLTLEEKQLKIENFIFNNWVDNLLDKLQNKDTTKIYSSNIGLDILKYSIKSINNALDNYKENRKYSKGKIYFTFIKLVNTNDLISITLRNVIPIMFNFNDLNEQKVISLFEKVGKEIVNNLCLNAYELYKKDNNINLTNKIIIKLKSNLSYIDFKDIIIDSIINYNKDLNNIIDIKEDLFYLIGGDIVEFLSKNSDLYKITIKKSNNISHRFILPDSIISDLICKHMIYVNQKLPMIVKPINWKLDDTNNDNILTYGGYLTNLNNKNHYIHKSHKNVGITKLINNDNIDCINYLQSVPFIINKELLNYLIDCINDNFDFNNLLPLELHSETNNLYKYILKKDNIIINNILSNNSKFNENRSYLSLAMLLQNYTFYHPLFMDWRGRIYTNSNVLSFQSSELSRSLIMFKDSVVLNKKGIESLQIYLANCFGLNKKSFSDRLNWTLKNHDNIINCKDNKFWLQAKEPFLFLSASFEYKNFLEDKSGNYISKLPVYIDATCNGLQHLAAMTNDINLAKYVNLLKSNNNDIPNDIYNEMANKVIINIKELVENNIDGKEYIKLTQLNINRSFINRGIMTISYGSTIRGIYDQLIEGSSKQFNHIEIKNNKNIYSVIDLTICSEYLTFTRKEIFKLASIIHNVLFISYPSLNILVN